MKFPNRCAYPMRLIPFKVFYFILYLFIYFIYIEDYIFNLQLRNSQKYFNRMSPSHMFIESTKKYCSKEKLKNNFKKGRSNTHHTLLFFFYQEKAK